jgi:hypothetical protein
VIKLIRRSAPFAVSLLVLGASPQAHALVPGGGPPGKVDCYAEWQVNTPDYAPGGFRILCEDGDPTCDGDGLPDGQCTFNISVCINQSNVAGCTPSNVQSIALTKKTAGFGIQTPATPSSDAVCGASAPVVVPLPVIPRGKNKGKRKASKVITLGMTAKSTSKPSTDRDKLLLRCLPARPALPCPASPSGPNEPNEIRLIVPGPGTDLDNGWKGPSHNFPTPAGTTFQLCLQNCNTKDDALCDVVANTGPNTFNGKYFGPPLPLISGGVPVCVLNNYAATTFTGGTARLDTGEINGPLNLASAIYLTSASQVCPSCEGATCDTGPAKGSSCHIDGVVTVSDPSAVHRTYHLSKDCPPDQSTFAGKIAIGLPLTTGTSPLVPLPTGNPTIPCGPAVGGKDVDPLADSCGSGTCSAKCSGAACSNPNGIDYVTGAPACVDIKGGISQLCCSTSTSTPCFPTGSPGGQITRTGKATVPQPPWPNPTYPKVTTCKPGACTVQVATFCEPGTDSSSVNGLTGLPGPGALILPVVTTWLIPAS